MKFASFLFESFFPSNPRLGTPSNSLQANQPLLVQNTLREIGRYKDSLPNSEKSQDLGYEGTPRTSVNQKFENNINNTTSTQNNNLKTHNSVRFQESKDDEGIEEYQIQNYFFNENFNKEPMGDIYEPTKNIQEQVLRKMGAKVLDVGGSEDQKRMWPFCFAGLSVVLFVVSMDEFAFELDYQEDTLILFSRLINNRYAGSC